MPLSNLFKKQPNKKNAGMIAHDAAKPSSDPSFLSPEIQKKRNAAAVDFLKLFQEKIPLVSGKPHAGTVLSVAARLAGSSLYRSLNDQKEITPGVIVLSDEVNEAWPQLMNLFAFYCKQNGMDVLSRPLVTKFSEHDVPRMDMEQVLAEYQDQYQGIMKKHMLDYLNSARAGMIVCSILFEYHCKTARDIDPFVATGIVAMGVVEGAKTAPLPLGSGSSMGRTSAKTVKNNDRLVLGEEGVAIQDALDHGGIFIDPGPEIIQMLQQRNIDPYIIYEKAMLAQLEKRVSRIDFVKVEVDHLFREWEGKPEDQMPYYVRLILWLKSNAAAHGYVQSGNSWVLK